MPADVECLHAIFHGDVQGVGFRYTTRRIASTFPELTGMVRNLSDGTVELIAEGSRQDLDALLTAISAKMQSYITTIETTYISSCRRFSAFQIGF